LAAEIIQTTQEQDWRKFTLLDSLKTEDQFFNAPARVLAQGELTKFGSINCCAPQNDRFNSAAHVNASNLFAAPKVL